MERGICTVQSGLFATVTVADLQLRGPVWALLQYLRRRVGWQQLVAHSSVIERILAQIHRAATFEGAGRCRHGQIQPWRQPPTPCYCDGAGEAAAAALQRVSGLGRYEGIEVDTGADDEGWQQPARKTDGWGERRR